MKKFGQLVLALLLVTTISHSQTLTLENDTGYPCHYVNISITASGFPTNIAAVTLFIAVDGNKVQCIGKIPGTINPNVNQATYDTIGISWSFPAPININGTLCQLVLHYDGGTAILDWDETSYEIVQIDFTPVTVSSFVNGSVTEGSYSIDTYYVDAAVPSSGNGLSWATAFKTITEAANLPLTPGEKVIIKPGTYNEKVIIKSNAGYSVRPQTGVVLSDTDKISFPQGANLSCVDLSGYPGQYYAYVYRSWKSNNGYYKVIEVNDAQNYVRVEGASFVPETGVAGNANKVMAAVGRPVIYKKDPAASESQRVIINAPNSAANDAFYIGLAIGDGQTNADSCNWNIIEGIDITNSSTGSLKGLHIQCSAYNTYAKGKVYNTTGTGGIGVIISGNNSRHAKFNIIQDNIIYNTPYQGILLGYTTNLINYNYSNFNHVIDNDLYLSGTGTLARFNNAVKVGYNNKSNVVDGNTFHDMKIYSINNGALLIESKADSTLVSNNIFRNIGKVNTGTHACIMVNDSSSKVNVFNNIIFNDDTVTNAVYAFRIDGKKHSDSKVAFNTIWKIDNGFYLEDNSVTTIDFGIHNNIISPTVTSITNSGTSGRFTVTYNLFRVSPGAPYASGTGQLFGDPLFLDPNGPSLYGLTLKPGSPALNNGLNLANISRDYEGDVRNSPTPTRGAFEKFLNCTWTGALSTNWHTSGNWLQTFVPQSFMRVTIPNVTNDPLISTSNATCSSISLSPGAYIKVQPPRTLTVNN